MSAEAYLVHVLFDPAAELADFIATAEGEGAVATFAGFARGMGRDGSALVHLFLDHHPRLTQSSLQMIADAALNRFYLRAALVIHRCGQILPGEPIVFVAAAAPHRRASLDAVDYMMDRLKTEAVLWKREDRADGSEWIDPTETDRADRARWGDE